MTTYAERLLAALEQRGPLCVGIDPHAKLLADWGLGDDVAGLERFALTAVEAIAPVAAVIKPQSAFFERFGARGVAVLEQVIATGRAAGAIVIVDAKRGDIGSTMAAYADAYLDPASPLTGDAVTISPYLGYGSLAPAITAAMTHDRGVFVLTLTSNPDGASVQRAERSGVSVAQSMVDAAGADNAGALPLGRVGLVVGATVGDLGIDLAALGGPVLVPGLGAQGGTPADIRRLFGDRPGVIGSTSRGVLAAGPDPAALRAATLRTADTLRS
jgi:orotidine-5'-phosphate decarboxylase